MEGTGLVDPISSLFLRMWQKSVQDFATHGKKKVSFFLSSQEQRLMVVVPGSASLCCAGLSKS
jgi:hypothetical protein